MVAPRYLAVLKQIVSRLADSDVPWAVTGSFGMALQGMPVGAHDIDLQTNQAGAYEIERRLAEYIVKPVRFLESERIHSHLGLLVMEGIQVEIMGALQKRLDDAVFEEPVQVETYRNYVAIEGIRVPVLSLDYEYQAYLKLGWIEKANRLRSWLETQRKGD